MMAIPIPKNLSVSQLSINLGVEGIVLSCEVNGKCILKGTWFLPIIFKQTNWTVRKNKKTGTKIVVRITKTKPGYWLRVLMEEEEDIDIKKCAPARLKSIVKNSELHQIDYRTQRSSNNNQNSSENFNSNFVSPKSNEFQQSYSNLNDNLNRSDSPKVDVINDNAAAFSQRKARYGQKIYDPPPPLSTSWSAVDFDKNKVQ